MQRYSAVNRLWLYRLWSQGLWFLGRWFKRHWFKRRWSSKKSASRFTKNQQALRTRSQLWESSRYRHNALHAMATSLHVGHALFSILVYKLQQFIYSLLCTLSYLSARQFLIQPKLPKTPLQRTRMAFVILTVIQPTRITQHPSPRYAKRSALDKQQPSVRFKAFA